MADKIKKLDHRAQAREKLSIWYGSRDNYYHGIKELIANAADELRNHATEKGVVEVKLFEGGKQIMVSDNGRGIRISGETDGEKNYDLLFRTLFAGTKYDVSDSITTGTNGVGTTVLNFTSKLFAVMSHYDGKVHKVKFVNGGQIDGEYFEKDLEEDWKNIHGSTLVVELDEDVYPKTTFDPKVVEEIVHHYAVAATNIEFIFSYEQDGEFIKKNFLYESPKEYFDEVVGSTTTSAIFTLGNVNIEEEVSVLSGSGNDKVLEKNKYEIFITTTPNAIQESYLNMTFLEEGGSIVDGVLDGIRLWANKYCREKKLFPAKVTAFSKEDIGSSISTLAIVESNIVEFANQTKLSTDKKLYHKQVKDYINSLLDAMVLQKPNELKKFINHILEVQKFNGANDKARQRLKKKLVQRVEGIGNKVKKLIDCEIHGKEAELFLTEGDSANGSIVDSRDDDFQAAFPLRGKVLNVLKAPIGKIFANEEILNMVKIIGTGISDGNKQDFNIDNARYGKIIITTDADADGGHIASLLIAFFYRFMRPLLENGYIYLAQTPLYELKFADDSVVYFLTEDEKNKNIGKYDGQKYTLNRLKGLGEVDAEVMYNTTMNPETRNIVRITVEDAAKMHSMVNDWMGEENLRRKEIITEQLPAFVHNVND